MREDILFCDGWQFSMCRLGAGYDECRDWKNIDLPHDWLIEDTRDLYKDSTGWYRRRLALPADGRRTSLRFEGVYMDCRVYVNGKPAGEWKYGYTTFELDITDLLTGDDLITVRVDHHAPNSRWYSGAGIYRKVLLRRYGHTHILPDGVYISADTNGKVTVLTEAARPLGESSDSFSVKTVIFRRQGDDLVPLCEKTSAMTSADRTALPEEITSDDMSYSLNRQVLHIPEPALWDISNPALYLCEVTILRDGEACDRTGTVFGLRSAVFTPDKGFFLNGKQVKLHGACMHHDLGALGAAVNRSAIERQLKKLREMGVNAIRTSHNPPAAELLELCDEMGIMVLDEGFDMWELPKTDYDYARFFREWSARDTASWIRRDRCHPCVIGWSIGNEIYDTHADDRGQEITSKLASLVRKHDPLCNAVMTIGSNYMAEERARRCADILGIAGYNYSERLYDKHHADHPDWAIFGSETSSVVSSRGIYHFPYERPILCEDDGHCSSLGNSAPVWASRCVEDNIIADRDREYCAGQFIWTGFDYIGEPTPYRSKNSYFGQYDTAGFAKDSAYIYRSAWTDHHTAPFVHIFPYWDFDEGHMTDIRVASNAPKVALFLDGELLKEECFDRRNCRRLTLDVKIPYRKGVLTAVAYDEKGNVTAKDTAQSFTDAVNVVLSPDKTEVHSGSDELIFIEMSAADKNGVFAANANDRVFVDVSGAGRLVGLDNGDETDYEQYKATSRRLFSGRLLAIVAPTEESGDILVKVTSPSLDTAEITLHSVPADPINGISFFHRCTPRKAECPDENTDIPVRRIGLSGERTHFDADHRVLTFRCDVFPENAVYGGDIEYRLTTEKGIVSGLAEITSAEGGMITVNCLGDGEFYLRALCRNGTDSVHIFTALKLTSEGIGEALTDPYSMVMGGLYDISENASNGIDHGAAFMVGGGWFGFSRVDFGAVGSDRITIPLFANYSTPVRIKVWDGTPENGELLGDLEYDIPTVWMTYQPKTYRLRKVLRGIHTISFESDLRYDVQGFVFERREKETAELPPSSAENIYGDTFTVSGGDVTGIGNNVILDFGEFDFSSKKPVKLYITGRSALEKNTVNLCFEGDCEKRMTAEFEGSDDYTERSYDISGISGKVRLSVVFLPGSDFDMRSLRFETE